MWLLFGGFCAFLLVLGLEAFVSCLVVLGSCLGVYVLIVVFWSGVGFLSVQFADGLVLVLMSSKV